MGGLADALTYHGLLSLFAALIALMSIIGLVGKPAKHARRSVTPTRVRAAAHQLTILAQILDNFIRPRG